MLAVLLLCAAKGALAQEATDRLFESLDLDGDGQVSIAEAAGTAAVVERFDRGDRNRDGRLSRKEFRNLKKVRVRSAAVGASAKSSKKKKDKAAASGG